VQSDFLLLQSKQWLIGDQLPVLVPTSISVVLKAGALGAPDFFYRAMDRMRAAETQQVQTGATK